MIEPAIEFSIAIIPKLESPLTTESTNSSNDKNQKDIKINSLIKKLQK